MQEKVRNNEAQQYYELHVQELIRYCEQETDLTALIIDTAYPFRVQFLPKPQISMFENENVDENGVINDLTVTVGLDTTVKSTLKFEMDSQLLKKLIKLAVKTGNIYYQAFREQSGDLEIND